MLHPLSQSRSLLQRLAARENRDPGAGRDRSTGVARERQLILTRIQKGNRSGKLTPLQ